MKRILLAVLAFVLLTAPAHAKTLTYAIGAANDDAFASVGGSSNYYEDYIFTPYYAATRYAYLRFPLRIPPNAVISSTQLSAIVHAGSASPIIIDLVDQDNCPDFATNPIDYTVVSAVDIPVTTTWTGTWTAGNTVTTTTDLTPLITAWINREGYTIGNYMALRIGHVSGSTNGYIRAYDYSSSDAAQLIITYTGGDVVSEIWMAEPHSRTKQYIYPHLINHDAGDVITVYLDDVLKHTHTITAGEVPANATDYYEFSYLMDYTALTAGAHHIDVYCKTSGGVQRSLSTKTWTTTHSGYPKVGIDENNSLCIRNTEGDGCTLFFPLTAFMWDQGKWYPAPGLAAFSNAINGLDTNGYCTTNNTACMSSYATKAADRIDPQSGLTWNLTGPGAGLYQPIGRARSYTTNAYSMGYFNVNTGSNGHYYRCTKAGVSNDISISGIGSTKTQVKTAAFNYTLSGTGYWKDAVAEGTAIPAETIPQNKWGLFAFFIGADGTIDVSGAAGNATGYDTEALAVAALPSTPADHFYMGRVTVMCTASGGFVGGTTNLDATGVTVHYSSVLLYPPTYCTTSGCVQNDGSSEWTEQGEFAAGMVGAVASANTNCETPSSFADCSYVNQLKGVDGVFGWKWKDEPGLGGMSITGGYSSTLMGQLYAATKAADTDHPVMTLHYGYDFIEGSNARENAYRYCWLTDSAYFSGTKTWVSDVTGGDVYPYQFIWKGLGGGVYITLENALTADDSYLAYNYALAPHYGIVAPMMTGGTGAECTLSYSYPTYAQLYNELWARVIHGAKGMVYFPFFCTIYDYQTEAAVAFKTALEAGSPHLDQVILQPKSSKYTPATRSVYSAGTGYVTVNLNHDTVTAGDDGRVDYMIREHGGKTYVFAARIKKYSGETFEHCSDTGVDPNHNYCAYSPAGRWPDPNNENTKNATITISDLTSGMNIKVIGESRNIAASNGSFTDAFTDYDVHIYEYEASGADSEAPFINTFSLPPSSTSLTVDVSSFTCSDEVGVTGYCVTTTNSSSGCSWSGTSPATITFAGEGSNTGYAWCKDAAGNVSSSVSASTTIDLTASYTLTVTLAGLGSGTVTSDVAGIDCGETCSADYDKDTVVTLTATASGDSVFAGWSGAGGCTGTSTCVLTMSAAKAATATFDPPTYTLTITYPTDGTEVADAGNGIDCGGDSYVCEYKFSSGTVTLTPSCATGFGEPITFTGDCSGSSCTLIMTQDYAVGVSCTSETHSLVVTPAAGCTVSADSGAIFLCTSGSGTCADNYDDAPVVTLTGSAAAAGYSFDGFSGSTCISGVHTCAVDMSADVAVTALCTKRGIINSTSGGGVGLGSGGGVGIGY